jgi:hypothetical protein
LPLHGGYEEQTVSKTIIAYEQASELAAQAPLGLGGSWVVRYTKDQL